LSEPEPVPATIRVDPDASSVSVQSYAKLLVRPPSRASEPLVAPPLVASPDRHVYVPESS
jgi:hypothetical protein